SDAREAFANTRVPTSHIIANANRNDFGDLTLLTVIGPIFENDPDSLVDCGDGCAEKLGPFLALFSVGYWIVLAEISKLFEGAVPFIVGWGLLLTCKITRVEVYPFHFLRKI